MSKAHTAPLPVLLCFDMEPDDRHVDGRPDEWPGVPATDALLTRWRERLAEVTGRPARFSWFVRLDPQVGELHGSSLWPVRRYADVFRGLHAAGDEVGLHVHLWRGDGGDDGRRWVCDFDDVPWMARCVESAFAAYEEAFGRPCRAFRFGERWMSQEGMALLDRLGVKFDLSLEPGHFDVASFDLKDHFRGSFPDCRGVPVRPYRPSRRDFRRAGRWWPPRRLWEIPVSTARTSVRTEPGSEVQTPFLSAPPGVFAEAIDDLLADPRTRHVAIVSRTDVGSRPDQSAPAEENMAHLAAWSRRRPLAFATPAEAVGLATGS